MFLDLVTDAALC